MARAGAREALRERLSLEGRVGDERPPVLVHPGIEQLRQAGVMDVGEDPVGRQEALKDAPVSGGLRVDDLDEDGALFLDVLEGVAHALGGEDDAEVAFADLAGEHERADGLSGPGVAATEQGLDVADAGVEVAARGLEDLQQRKDPIGRDAALGQGPRERGLGVDPADVLGIEREQRPAHRRHLVQCVKALELFSQNVRRSIHGSSPVARAQRRGDDALAHTHIVA